MKKIFTGTVYLLVQIMLFTYMIISKDIGNDYYNSSLLDVIGETGIAIIGFVFIFPAFILTIISLCNNKKGVIFCRDLISTFVGIFCLITGIMGIAPFLSFIYIPIIIIVCSVILLSFSLTNVIVALIEDNKKEVKE